MTAPRSIQTQFLEQIKNILAPNLSFADELAEHLSISRDSAYRRIRGETVLSLDEVKILSSHFGVSLDALVVPESEMISFNLRALNAPGYSFEKWLKSLLGNLEMISTSAQGEMSWHAKDLPIFHYFQFPRLAAFKLYFWMKAFTRDTTYAEGKYQTGMIPNSLIALGERVWSKYASVTSTEIINHEVLNVTLRQIEFAHESGMFADKDEALQLCNQCSELLGNLKVQASLGKKRTFGEQQGGGTFNLYLDEVLIGDNTVLLKMENKRVVIITHNNFNLLTTSQETFCNMTEQHMHMMIRKSTQISNSSEKERNKYFNKLEERVQRVRSRI